MKEEIKKKILSYISLSKFKGYFKQPTELSDMLEIESYLKRIPIEKEIDRSGFKVTPGQIMSILPIKKFPYLIDKLIPEKAITSLTADSGKGKSLLALIMAQSVASGKPFLNEFTTKQTKILIIDQEMDSDLIIGRFKSVILDNESRDNIDFMYEQFWLIDNKANYDWLVQIIKDREYGFLILDTLTMIHNAEENSSTEMRKVNELLLSLIADTGITIMYLHHHRKSLDNERTGMQSSRGSTEIIAKVASHLAVESKKRLNENDEVVLDMTILQAKTRRPESITKIGLEITYDKEMERTRYHYKGVVDDDQNRLEEAVRHIISLFERNNAARTVDAIKSSLEGRGVKLGDNSIRNALKVLVDEGTFNKATKKQMILDGKVKEDEVKHLNARSQFYWLVQD